MRIAFLIFAVLTVLGLVGFGLATQRLWDAHTNVIQETRQSALARARSDWYEATVALSFERSVTQVALALDTPISDVFRDLIDEQRAQSDALVTSVLAQVADISGFEHDESFRTAVRAQQEAIKSLRLEADEMVSQPAFDRDTKRADQMPYDLKAEIERMFSNSALLAVKGGATSVQGITASRVQALAWEIREYAGRARTFYAIATLTGEPIPLRFSGEARIDTARAVAAWDSIQIERQLAEFPEVLNAAFRTAEVDFRETYLQALETLDLEMAAMRRTPDQAQDMALSYAFEDFFTLSNQGLDAVAEIVPVAGGYVQQYWLGQIRQARQSRALSAVIALVTFLMTCSSVYLMHRRLVQPLAAATCILHAMSEGDLSREFRRTRRKRDELRVMWDAMEALNKSLRAARDFAEKEKEVEAEKRAAEERAKQGIIGELMTGLEQMAQGDLTYEIRDEYGPAYGDLISNFNNTGSTLREAIGNVVATANNIAQHSEGLSTAIDDLSHRSENQMRIVSETTQGLRNVIEMLEETARNTKGSLQTVREAAGKSEAGLQVVDCAIKAMDDIHTSSNNIRGFGNVIDEIAFQTNLLALNAGVEAARAGDRGKGFGVVAQEVRSLAGQASDAAQQVKQQVEAGAVSVISGVEEVKKTGQSLEEIFDMVAEAKKRIEQIESDSRMQSGTVAQLGDTMEEVDAISRQNAEMAVQVTGTSVTLKHSAEDLRASVARFAIGQGIGAATMRRSA